MYNIYHLSPCFLYIYIESQTVSFISRDAESLPYSPSFVRPSFLACFDIFYQVSLENAFSFFIIVSKIH